MNVSFGDILAYLLIGGLSVWSWIVGFRVHREVRPSSWLAIRVPKTIAVLFAGVNVFEPVLDVSAIAIQLVMPMSLVGMTLRDMGIVNHAEIVPYLMLIFMVILIVSVFCYNVWRKWRQRRRER